MSASGWRTDSPTWAEDYFVEVRLKDGAIRRAKVLSSWRVEFDDGETTVLGLDCAGWRDYA